MFRDRHGPTARLARDAYRTGWDQAQCRRRDGENTSVKRLETAAFLAPDRHRAPSWQQTCTPDSRDSMSTVAVPVESTPAERRRYHVRWPVWLSFGERNTPVETRTTDISSSEFGCFCPESLEPGEIVSCQIRIPSWTPGEPEDALTLTCRVRVLSVLWDASASQFDFRFGIEHYSVRSTRG